MIALDFLEQMHPQALELIGADALQNVFTGGGKIRVERVDRERAHGEMRGRNRLKQNLAIALMRTLQDESVLLWQVACEYINASRKLQSFGLNHQAALQTVRDLQLIWRFVMPTPTVLSRAVQLISTRSLSFWDAMIIAACAEAGVTRLYSEDLSMYPVVDGVELINPFA